MDYSIECSIMEKRKGKLSRLQMNSLHISANTMEEKRQIEAAVYAFGLEDTCTKVEEFGKGHINRTYAVSVSDDRGTEIPDLSFKISIQRYLKTWIR